MRSNFDLENLLDKVASNREELNDMLQTLSNLRRKTESMFSSSNDFRNKFVLDTKLKTMSELFKNELAVRKEINDSIKMEIDLSMKISGGESDDSSITPENIDKICEMLEESANRKSNISQTHQ